MRSITLVAVVVSITLSPQGQDLVTRTYDAAVGSTTESASLRLDDETNLTLRIAIVGVALVIRSDALAKLWTQVLR